MDFYDDDEYDNYEDDDEEVLPPPGDHPESPERVHDLKLGISFFIYKNIYIRNFVVYLFLKNMICVYPPY